MRKFTSNLTVLTAKSGKYTKNAQKLDFLELHDIPDFFKKSGMCLLSSGS